jgi:hypothetical protein
MASSTAKNGTDSRGGSGQEQARGLRVLFETVYMPLVFACHQDKPVSAEQRPHRCGGAAVQSVSEARNVRTAEAPNKKNPCCGGRHALRTLQALRGCRGEIPRHVDALPRRDGPGGSWRGRFEDGPGVGIVGVGAKAGLSRWERQESRTPARRADTPRPAPTCSTSASAPAAEGGSAPTPRPDARRTGCRGGRRGGDAGAAGRGTAGNSAQTELTQCV